MASYEPMNPSKCLNPITAIILSLCVVLLAACSRDVEPAADENIPPSVPPGDGDGLNLLLITIDTLRADHLGAYGYARDTSPTLDRLAAEGALFEQLYAPRGLTWTSLATLMTSLYPIDHGIRTNGIRISGKYTTLAEILQAKGYATAAFMAENVEDQYWEGFDFLRTAEDPELNERAIRWLGENHEKPFFAWLHYFGPHKPYTPPEEYAQRFSPNYTGKYKGESEYTTAITLHQKELAQPDLDHLLALYDGLIARTDDLIAEILAQLETLGVADNTLIVITSDHGEDLYDYNKYFYHLASVYDSSLHIPMIIHLPGTVPAGTRVPKIIENIDTAPTILDLMGWPNSAAFRGESLRPLIEGQDTGPGYAIAEWEDKILTIRTNRYRYVLNPTSHNPEWVPGEEFERLPRMDWYKQFTQSGELDASTLVMNYTIGQTELYDLANHPTRPVDRLDDYQDDLTRLNQQLKTWQEDNDWEFLSGFLVDIDPDVQRQLEALGYVF